MTFYMWRCNFPMCFWWFCILRQWWYIDSLSETDFMTHLWLIFYVTSPVTFLRPHRELLHQPVRVSPGDHSGHHPRGHRDGALHPGLLHHGPLPHRRRPHRPRVRPHLPPRHRQCLHLLWEEASLRHRHCCVRLWSGNFYFITINKMVSFSFSLNIPYNLLLKRLLTQLGWKGSFLVLSVMILAIIIFGCLMRPLTSSQVSDEEVRHCTSHHKLNNGLNRSLSSE